MNNYKCKIIIVNNEFISKDTFKHPPLNPLPSREGQFLSPLSLEGLRLVEERARVRVCGFTYELLSNCQMIIDN